MFNRFLEWIGTTAPRDVVALLGLAGTLIVFLGWQWRKTNLEIRKLKLEVADLQRRESVIVKPTLEQIEKIQRDTSQWRSTIKVGITGVDELDRFAADLRIFLTMLRAYLGDASARAEVFEAKLRAAMLNQIDPYASIHQTGEDGQWVMPFPDPTSLARRWSALRATCGHELSQRKLRQIDRILVFALRRARHV